ncbi:hypothetical protein RHODO2019_18555 (plasmid) [Rhodococcus antarcticus]|uniref:Uncharacterized protein n=1 Tax=Rhodococcus antarcticus TaxID=2987751 RepID=A0ABY6P5Q4_9NOCA|nr:hypothetical protein [Rhodococcus antarcticus]UZJ26994.1 hypothetical protein RHODO2019_18555 [Rhodococcus antarcticus]
MTDQSSVLRGTPAATREVRQAASIQTLLPEPSCAQPSLPAGLSGGATMATAVVDVDVVVAACAGTWTTIENIAVTAREALIWAEPRRTK